MRAMLWKAGHSRQQPFKFSPGCCCNQGFCCVLKEGIFGLRDIYYLMCFTTGSPSLCTNSESGVLLCTAGIPGAPLAR